MRRLAIIVALIAACTTATPTHARPAPCGGRTVKATIWCAVHHYGYVPGGIRTALYIAERESGFNPQAVSYTGCCFGVYQWHHDTWATLIERWPEMNRLYGTNVFNARANIMRAIRTAHESGWGPWSM